MHEQVLDALESGDVLGDIGEAVSHFTFALGQSHITFSIGSICEGNVILIFKRVDENEALP